MERTAVEGKGWQMVLEAFHDAFFTGFIQIRRQHGYYRNKILRLLPQLFVGIGYMVLFVAFQVCGVVTALLATTSSAISAHPDCGTYIADSNTPEEIRNITAPYEFAVQSASASWARDCYNVQGTPDGCSFFLNQSISYTVENSSCPFAPELCLGGTTSPVRFSTGQISGRIIGINAPKTFDFNRTTVCSPLNMNETFVSIVEKKGIKYTFEYYYGSTGTWGGASWQSVRYEDIGQDPTYLVRCVIIYHLRFLQANKRAVKHSLVRSLADIRMDTNSRPSSSTWLLYHDNFHPISEDLLPEPTRRSHISRARPHQTPRYRQAVLDQSLRTRDGICVPRYHALA